MCICIYIHAGKVAFSDTQGKAMLQNSNLAEPALDFVFARSLTEVLLNRALKEILERPQRNPPPPCGPKLGQDLALHVWGLEKASKGEAD